MIDLNMSDIRQSLFKGLADIRLLLAIPLVAALTYILAQSGIDAWVNDFARKQNPTFSIIWSAFPMIAGMVVPFLLPVILALRGEKKLAEKTLSVFLASIIIVSILKGFTSRVHPEALEPASSLLKSQIFRFGFLQSGFSSLIEGWPSGHTTTNGAVGLTIAKLSSIRWVSTLAISWVIWVFMATIFGISGDVHWLSDTISGFILALVITSRIKR